MTALRAFFTGAHVADMVLIIMALEFIGLSWRALSIGHPRRIGVAILALGPGACLTLALRAALAGDAWPWVAVWITAALPFHVGDLIRRHSTS